MSEHNHPDGVPLDEIEKNFATLASELKDGDIRIDNLIENKVKPDNYKDYQPTVLDYLARAQTVEQCMEIIEYCFQKDEISEEYAEELREKVKKKGPNSFGNREPGFYEKKL